MKNIFNIRKKRSLDNKEFNQWLDSGLKLPPPEAVKYRKLIDRKKVRKIKIIYATQTYISTQKALLNADFSEVLDLNDFGTKQHDKAIIWLNQEIVNSSGFYVLVEKIFSQVKSPEILIDGAIQMMQKDAVVSLWALKQFITSRYPGYFYHSHNDIVIISPSL